MPSLVEALLKTQQRIFHIAGERLAERGTARGRCGPGAPRSANATATAHGEAAASAPGPGEGGGPRRPHAGPCARSTTKFFF